MAPRRNLEALDLKAPENALLAEARSLRLKREFSQNFLVREEYLTRIVETLQPEPSETLLEIGPGAGFLTRLFLPQVAQLIAVDLDPRMIAYLRKKLGEAPALQLIQQDILKFDLASIEAPSFKVVGNLPYHITSPILFKLAGELWETQHPLRQRIQQATLMVQKEVGERITALPGRKAYNPLSIALQYWFEATLDFTLPANAFYPAPKVDSAVVTLVPRSGPKVPVRDLQVLDRLLRSAFAQRRKTLRNSLLNTGFAPVEVLEALFQETGIDPTLRPEALSIEEFGALADAFVENTG